MLIGIDATCLRGGGGSETHFRHFIRQIILDADCVDHLVIFTDDDRREYLQITDERVEIVRVELNTLNYIMRVLRSNMIVSMESRERKIDVLFVPGCVFTGRYRPYVSMSRNMLPWDTSAMLLYKYDLKIVKFILLRVLQHYTFRLSHGIIFLNEYARDVIMSKIQYSKTSFIVPHGVVSHRDSDCQVVRNTNTIRILYVSTIDRYKHQIEFLAFLSKYDDSNIKYRYEVLFAGNIHPPLEKRYYYLLKTVNRTKTRISVKHLGYIHQSKVQECYADADVIMYLSSCENMPNIVLEAMSAVKPILCLDIPPMNDLITDHHAYVRLDNLGVIMEKAADVVDNPQKWAEIAAVQKERADSYTWKRCYTETMSALKSVADSYLHQER